MRFPMRFPFAAEVNGSHWKAQTKSGNTKVCRLRLQVNVDVLSLFVTAPQRELEFVKCTWKQGFQALQNFCPTTGKDPMAT